jgi:hypothetical protein
VLDSTQAVDDGRVPDDLLGWADCTYHDGHLVAEIQVRVSERRML